MKDFCKKNKITSVGLSDTSNLCGSLEFSENISKAGTQPIIGTQINFTFEGNVGLLPLIAINENGYKRILDLSSQSYLLNKSSTDPNLDLSELLMNNEGIIIFSGTIRGFFGKSTSAYNLQECVMF